MNEFEQKRIFHLLYHYLDEKRLFILISWLLLLFKTSVKTSVVKVLFTGRPTSHLSNGRIAETEAVCGLRERRWPWLLHWWMCGCWFVQQMRQVMAGAVGGKWCSWQGRWDGRVSRCVVERGRLGFDRKTQREEGWFGSLPLFQQHLHL